MIVVYIKENNKWYIANSLEDLDYSNLSFSFAKDIFGKSEEEINKYMIVKKEMFADDGKLIYSTKAKQWQWHVYKEALVTKGAYLNGINIATYSKPKIKEIIPLVNKMVNKGLK